MRSKKVDDADSTLIEKIRAKLRAEGTHELPKPATEKLVADAERELGFALPALLKLVYREVADGGFGPGHGIYGIGHRKLSDDTLVEHYRGVQEGAKYFRRKWKNGLLPFCEWGCTICSCVDCLDSELTVFEAEECEAYEQSYSLSGFFEMWLAGKEILGSDNPARETAEIVNPFTGEKTTVFGGRKKKGR